MLTIDSLAKRGHQAEDLSYFPCWKKEEAALETEVLRSCDMNIMSLPYCHHGFGIKDGGLTLKAWVSFELERLHRVRQLAFVKHPFVLSMAGDIDEGLCFDHSRGMHVLDVMSVITLIAENNRSELPLSHRTLTPIYNTLRLAALTHDALTPAGGDTIKTLDPEALDEDAHYFDLFRDPETSEERIALCVKYGVNIHDLTETVQGKGLAGTVLDMADKTAYVARDTSQFMNYCFASRRRKVHFPEYAPIAKLVEKDPWICGWWESVRVKRDYAWVEDGERLGRFLELRLRMFRGLYYHGKRTMDIILPVVVAGHLYASGQLTRADLLQMSDEQLERRIAKFCGVPHFNLRKVAPAETCLERFATEAEARQRERELVASGLPFVHMENIQAPLKPSTNKFLVKRPGKASLEGFSDAYPAKAEELQALTRVKQPFRLCYFREDSLPPDHRKDLLAYRRKQVGLDQA